MRPSRYVKILTLAAAIAVFGATNASASSVTFNLNCSFAGPSNSGVCNSDGPFGTITLSDNASNSNWVDIVVALTGAYSSGDLSRFYLNLDPAFTVLSGYSFSVTGGSVTRSTNNAGPGSYDYLDLSIDPSGSNNPWSGTLKLKKESSYQNLNVSTFNVLSNDSQLTTPVFAGASFSLTETVQVWNPNLNCGWTRVGQSWKYVCNGGWDTDCQTTDYYVGSLPETGPLVPTDSVPEPSTLVLFGGGLVLAAARLRKARQN